MYADIHHRQVGRPVTNREIEKVVKAALRRAHSFGEEIDLFFFSTALDHPSFTVHTDEPPARSVLVDTIHSKELRWTIMRYKIFPNARAHWVVVLEAEEDKSTIFINRSGRFLQLIAA